MNEIARYTYKHDGNPMSNATLEIERLAYDGTYYRFEVRCTDPTDYERSMTNVVLAFGGNPTFGRDDG